VRRLLTKYHYPPDKKSAAVALVLEQAERLAAATVTVSTIVRVGYSANLDPSKVDFLR
jgi:hypothetical protein